jgi:hypothetical protein
MGLIRCPGCQKSYENRSSISAHQRTYVRLTATTKKLVKKRDKNCRQRESAKVLWQELSQGNNDVLEVRAEVRERVNTFDAEEESSRKRKLGGTNLVSLFQRGLG